jgi:hypothetical protein
VKLSCIPQPGSRSRQSIQLMFQPYLFARIA